MEMLAQLSFLGLLVVAGFLFYKRANLIKRTIFLGKPGGVYDQKAERWKRVLLLAFGQKKMFKNPLVAFLHFIIYAGFIIINLEVLEIVIDGISGQHRIFAPFLGNYYRYFINGFEILAFGVTLVCIIFLIRRNILYIKRLRSNDLAGWPKTDANIILIAEIVLMTLFFLMNGADQALQTLQHPHYVQTGSFIISGSLSGLLSHFSVANLLVLERTCWWLHIIGILAFLNYLPYSKHLHIILAFPSAYYSSLEPAGKLTNMPSVQNEVLYAMDPSKAPSDAAPPTTFGAKDVFDLSWKNLMEAYSCTECGRCSTACPATSTGKLLSPRKIMMATRDRLEEVGKNISINSSFVDDQKTLLHNYISVEELRACTTCNACVEACPVSLSPLNIIMELRRSLIMEESNAPSEWNNTFSNIENNFAPWKFSPEDRENWVKEN
ncbi:MAG: (Fe-S)-binding protein [Bacteroidetes bacterium]|jgi:ferredoxin|nr:(Fe-S)-binding protein [Bacteroidota bacterium]